MTEDGVVIAVCRSATHTMRKESCAEIRLLAGHGVEGDAHAGTTVQHRSRLLRTPGAPNLRQVHLLHAELFDELRARGYALAPGAAGENITTRGLDLLALPTGTLLAVGDDAVLEVTGLRNPCTQLDGIQQGLMHAVLDRAPDGSLRRKAGVMCVVRTGGVVRPSDPVRVSLPSGTHVPLQPV